MMLFKERPPLKVQDQFGVGSCRSYSYCSFRKCAYAEGRMLGDIYGRGAGLAPYMQKLSLMLLHSERKITNNIGGLGV
jgi:hypothetical protein